MVSFLGLGGSRKSQTNGQGHHALEDRQGHGHGSLAGDPRLGAATASANAQAEWDPLGIGRSRAEGRGSDVWAEAWLHHGR